MQAAVPIEYLPLLITTLAVRPSRTLPGHNAAWRTTPVKTNCQCWVVQMVPRTFDGERNRYDKRNRSGRTQAAL